MEKKTPLYDTHVIAGGRMVPFAGFLLPVQYETGIIEEHNAVRKRAGLFDISHMGEILLEGPDSFASIQYLFTNDFTDLPDGGMRYSLMCNRNGGVIDDVIVYRYDINRFMVVVNASNTTSDYNWMSKNIKGDTVCTDIS